MDKFFHSAFDFFTHAIPGFIVVATIALLGLEFSSFNELISFSNGIKIGGGILVFTVSYIAGFAIHPIGRFLYKTLGFKIWKESIANDVEIPISDKYILIRELSPSNFKYVETWNMFCAMAHNLAVSSLFLVGGSLTKLIQSNFSNGLWFFIMSIGVALFFIFLHRAVVFSMWAANDLNATISRLNLVKKAASFANTKSESLKNATKDSLTTVNPNSIIT